MISWKVGTLMFVAFLFTHGAQAQESVLYINDTENEISPSNSLGLKGNYPTYTISDRFTTQLSNVSELRVPLARGNFGSNGCDYNKFTIYEDGNEIYSTSNNFDINYLSFQDAYYDYTNDTEQWSSFRIDSPIDLNTTSLYTFEFKTGAYYCYFSFVESGSGLPRISINGDPRYQYNALYALLGPSNSAPDFNLTNYTVSEGALLSIDASATDLDGNGLTYSAGNLPAGATYDSVSGSFSWTPDYEQAGNHIVTFTATDDGDPALSASINVTITVEETNRAPILNSIGDQIINESQVLEFTVSASDPDNNSLTYTATNLPAGSTFNSQTGFFSWIPRYDQAGNYTDIEFTATDNGTPVELDSELITITVNEQSPVFETIGSRGVLYINDTEDEISPFNSLGLKGNYPTYTISDRFTTALSDVAELRIPLAKHTSSANGCDYNKFTIYEDGNEVYSTADDFSINYLAFQEPYYNYTNDTEQWSSFKIEPPLDLNTTSLYTFEFKTGAYYCYFSFVESGSGLPRITINDPYYQYNALYALLELTNSAPSFNLLNQTGSEGMSLSFNAAATDPDGDGLVYSVNGVPDGATFDTTSGLFTWTPDYNQAGNYELVVEATDDGVPALSASTTITIEVLNINRAPELSPVGNQTVSENQNLTFTVSAADPDGDVLTYTAANLPAGASFDTQTQTFSWTPEYNAAGNYENIEFSVMDNGSPMEVDVELITITVGNINRAPIIVSPGAQEALEEDQVQFTVTASDPDSDSFTFAATNLPLGASFDPQTGSFTWTPSLSQDGVYTVTFTATDTGLPAETGTIDVVITVGDNPTPIEQSEDIIEDIVVLDLPTNIENSYMANLQKVAEFIQQGKIQAAINQLNAFINKVNQDYAQGALTQEESDNLIGAAEGLIEDLD